MAHFTVGMRLEASKGAIVKAMEYMQLKGIKFIQSKGFYGEDEGKEKVRLYTTALIDFPQDGDEMVRDIEKINSGENVITDFSKIKEPNDITYAALEKSEQNEDMYGPFESVEDLMKSLNE